MRTRHRRQRGFTLTEMLVVLGIILVLVSILLPAVMAAQRQSRKTACAARLRALGQALQIYLSENDDTLPQACMSNSLDSMQSRVGFTFHKDQPDHSGPPGFTLPMAPIAYALQKGAPVMEKVWSCPATRTGKAGYFRNYQFVQTRWPIGSEVPNLLDKSIGPLMGDVIGVAEFKPGYQFMGGGEFWWSIFSGQDDTNRKKYHYTQFATRNIAGLKLEEIKPQGGQSPADVVTFADYSVMAHNKETDDMWQESLSKPMGNYSANFLYLDGHVAYHEFKSVRDYLRILHKPIPQTWGAGKIQDALNAPDVWDPATASQ